MVIHPSPLALLSAMFVRISISISISIGEEGRGKIDIDQVNARITVKEIDDGGESKDKENRSMMSWSKGFNGGGGKSVFSFFGRTIALTVDRIGV